MKCAGINTTESFGVQHYVPGGTAIASRQVVEASAGRKTHCGVACPGHAAVMLRSGSLVGGRPAVLGTDHDFDRVLERGTICGGSPGWPSRA